MATTGSRSRVTKKKIKAIGEKVWGRIECWRTWGKEIFKKLRDLESHQVSEMRKEIKNLSKQKARWVAVGRQRKLSTSSAFALGLEQGRDPFLKKREHSSFMFLEQFFFWSFIGLTIWLLLNIHRLHSKLLILHWRASILRPKMSGNQAFWPFAHLGQKKLKK